MSPTLKVAAAILAVVVLVGAGWAAEKIYEKLKFTEATLILENNPPQEWKLSNGNTMTTSGMIGTDVNPEDPQAIETAQRHHEEMKELIAEKKYTFLKTIDNKIDGSTQYVYNFTFSDGKQSAVNFAMPLDEVASWDDYQRKIQETRNRYQEQVNKAIAAGKYRLINQDVIFMHICVDRASQEMIRVQRIPLSDGKEIALYRSYDLVDQEQGTTQPQSSWQEHLQAIRCSAGLSAGTTGAGLASSAGSRTSSSSRSTSTLVGASMPTRTLSPEIFTIVTTIESPRRIRCDSLRERTSIDDLRV
jgi:hypothetical protein